MVNKMAYSAMAAYYRAKARFSKIASDESGMETIQAVILIAIAVVLGGVIINFLTGTDGNGGIISTMFESIRNQITSIFGRSPDQI